MIRKRSRQRSGARCGVYCIVHKLTGRMYIGSSNDIANRSGHHRFMLRNGKHKNKALHLDWNFFGEASYEFRDLELCNPELLSIREEYWLSVISDVYNLSRSASGYVRNEQLILKLHQGRDARWARQKSGVA